MATTNTFINAFANYLYSQNLSASVSDLGAMEGIGFGSEGDRMETSLRLTGFYFLQEEDLLDALHWAIAEGNNVPYKKLAIGVRPTKGTPLQP
jgi:hypothetical protein